MTGYGAKMKEISFPGVWSYLWSQVRRQSKRVGMLVGDLCGSVHLKNFFSHCSNFLVKLEAKSLSESENGRGNIGEEKKRL